MCGLISPPSWLLIVGMDPATLYMIATMPNGQMRTFRWSEDSVGRCEEKIRHLARKDRSGKSLKILGWCPDNQMYIAH
jgi:hypothetical protein